MGGEEVSGLTVDGTVLCYEAVLPLVLHHSLPLERFADSRHLLRERRVSLQERGETVED